MINGELLRALNAPSMAQRLEALEKIHLGTAYPQENPRYINNHIHTSYSFSPYSPTAAVYAARCEGLSTAGIVDHDTMAGAKEFLQAAKLINMPVTVGMECRVSFAGTPFECMRINNPDQLGVSYMTIQSVPHGSIDAAQAWFAPYRAARNVRNEKIIANINAILGSKNIAIAIDFKRDVLPLSMWDDGGAVTERHLMLCLANALIKKAGTGGGLIAMLEKLNVSLDIKQERLLLDTQYPFYAYDVLGILKGSFLPSVYVDAFEECPSLEQTVAFAKSIDAILCYAYLGDITVSGTGDKVAQKFEDEHLDQLFGLLHDFGVRAFTYMPARNTRKQLLRVRELCDRFGMFQVSGEDVNSPRQSFVCPAMEDRLFDNLIKNTWTLIEHERG